MNFSRAALALASLLCLFACSSPKADDPDGPGGPTGAVCPTGSPYTYANFAKAFFSNYCIRCHGSDVVGSARNGAPPERNFDTYTGVLTTEASLMDSVAAAGPNGINTFMPRSAPRPTDMERYHFGEWLACHRPP